MLDALDGLEDHLSDMDMARDFHDALGGWPSLTNLLLPTQSLKVRAAAALVMGTAVKNQDEFQGWILEPVPLSLSTEPASEVASRVVGNTDQKAQIQNKKKIFTGLLNDIRTYCLLFKSYLNRPVFWLNPY